jgi:hypothetical protein
MASASLLSGFVLCNFGAQADVPYSKIGWWSVAYLEVGNLSGCRAVARFPDQTIFQMVQIQSGTDKGWVIFIANPKWNAWIGKRPRRLLPTQSVSRVGVWVRLHLGFRSDALELRRVIAGEHSANAIAISG